MKKFLVLSTFLLTALMVFPVTGYATNRNKPVHNDEPFRQDYSIKYYFNEQGVNLIRAASDRNGKIQVLSSEGLLHPHNGRFLYPGTLEIDGTYRPMAD